jgi:hypothetical protein
MKPLLAASSESGTLLTVAETAPRQQEAAQNACQSRPGLLLPNLLRLDRFGARRRLAFLLGMRSKEGLAEQLHQVG